jgi:isohexenylglutaconyl-CoA hydratase
MAMPQIPELQIKRRKPVVFATFNRPAEKNALNGAIIDGLFVLAAHLREDPQARALVLRGAGGTFCAGGDLKDFGRQLMTPDPADGDRDLLIAANRRFGDLLLALDALPQVLISVVEGAAFAGGLGFVAVSDVAIAATDAKFAVSEVTLGLAPAQIAPFLVRKIGLFEARRLALTGKRFDATAAREIGLVSEVVDAGRLDAALLETLNAIGRCEPQAIAATKSLLRRSSPLDERLLDEAAAEFARCLRGAGRVGAASFAAKKPPPWVETYERLECRRVGMDDPLFEAILDLRDSVLRAPLGRPTARLEAERDARGVHFAAIEAGAVVGCLALYPQGEFATLRSMAVAPDRQGAGVGAELYAYAEEWARTEGIKAIEAEGRSTALGFYEAQGFRIEGDEYLGHGIPHRKARKELTRG